MSVAGDKWWINGSNGQRERERERENDDDEEEEGTVGKRVSEWWCVRSHICMYLYCVCVTGSGGVLNVPPLIEFIYTNTHTYIHYSYILMLHIYMYVWHVMSCMYVCKMYTYTHALMKQKEDDDRQWSLN